MDYLVIENKATGEYGSIDIGDDAEEDEWNSVMRLYPEAYDRITEDCVVDIVEQAYGEVLNSSEEIIEFLARREE